MYPMSLLSLLLVSGTPSTEVGRVGLDIKGNDLVIEAFEDPKVDGVTCHVAHFDRGTIEKLVHGNWFENPSNMSIACEQTGPITVHEVDTSADGEVVFSERASFIFKHIRIRRIVDYAHQTLVYVAYSSKVTESSAKNSLSTVSLFNTGAKLPPRK
jgi:CreA protein